MLDIFIFDVGLGQCIFFYPRDNPEYGFMVDCGSTTEFDPVDKLIEWNMFQYNSEQKKLGLYELALTNYDEDHFSGLPYLRSKVYIKSVKFPKNLTGDEIKGVKQYVTQPMAEVVEILKTYIYDVKDYNPPYIRKCFCLEKTDFPNEAIDTNKLSQLVFLTMNNIRICIPGDLPEPAWDKHLQNPKLTSMLSDTNILVASHHGREDGFNLEVFTYCKPECIILSDKHLVHDTQEGMASKYANFVKGNGIVLNGNNNSLRKTLTTRNDGHIWIRIETDGTRVYKTV